VAIALVLNVKDSGSSASTVDLHPPGGHPPIIVATVWRNMFDRNPGDQLPAPGNDRVLFKIPPDALRLDWLNYPNPIFAVGPFILPLAYFALLTANVWLGWPLNSVVATGALQAVPKELYEAAEMDGAGAGEVQGGDPAVSQAGDAAYAIYGSSSPSTCSALVLHVRGGPFGRPSCW